MKFNLIVALAILSICTGYDITDLDSSQTSPTCLTLGRLLSLAYQAQTSFPAFIPELESFDSELSDLVSLIDQLLTLNNGIQPLTLLQTNSRFQSNLAAKNQMRASIKKQKTILYEIQEKAKDPLAEKILGNRLNKLTTSLNQIESSDSAADLQTNIAELKADVTELLNYLAWIISESDTVITQRISELTTYDATNCAGYGTLYTAAFGDFFNSQDFQDPLQDNKCSLKKINLNVGGSSIDGIQIILDCEGQEIVNPWHGASTDSPTRVIPSAKISKVEINSCDSGCTLYGLGFYYGTESQRFGRFTDSMGTRTFVLNGEIVGVHGRERTGETITRIGFLVIDKQPVFEKSEAVGKSSGGVYFEDYIRPTADYQLGDLYVYMNGQKFVGIEVDIATDNRIYYNEKHLSGSYTLRGGYGYSGVELTKVDVCYYNNHITAFAFYPNSGYKVYGTWCYGIVTRIYLNNKEIIGAYGRLDTVNNELIQIGFILKHNL